MTVIRSSTAWNVSDLCEKSKGPTLIITGWATSHEMTKVGTELKAVTSDSDFPSKPLSDHDGEECESETPDVPNEKNALFNFQEWYSTIPLIYKPNSRGTYFLHHGRWFYWSTGQRENRCGVGYDQTISIRCLGRSTQPVKDLLSDVKGFTLTKEIRTTEVYRSALKPNDQGSHWVRQSVRVSRPMCTISLDQGEKDRLLLDISEYLNLATARWYANRGIPYRRGYLFHGPAGTGKTSLSFASAGVFGLSIYCISLGEAGLTESDLATLFGSLPERCIVLLEDIDSAGLRREISDRHASAKSFRSKVSDSNPGFDDAPLPNHGARSKGRTALHQRQLAGTYKDKATSLITLAGLLNIIDGAASQEVCIALYLLSLYLLISCIGTRVDYDYQLPLDIGSCPDPTRPGRFAD
jgi:chaperone BCS1